MVRAVAHPAAHGGVIILPHGCGPLPRQFHKTAQGKQVTLSAGKKLQIFFVPAHFEHVAAQVVHHVDQTGRPVDASQIITGNAAQKQQHDQKQARAHGNLAANGMPDRKMRKHPSPPQAQEFTPAPDAVSICNSV